MNKNKINPLATNPLSYHYCLLCASKLLKSDFANSISQITKSLFLTERQYQHHQPAK